MALFPAYVSNDTKETYVEDEPVRWEANSQVISESNNAMEAQLLASDTEDENDKCMQTESKPVVNNDDFYVDCKMDRGNLRVSTLYYPGRPQYECRARTLGGGGRASGRAPRRYFRRRASEPPPAAGSEAAAERAAAFRRLLHDAPHDIALWERYIDFQERFGAERAAAEACGEAARRTGARRLRARLYAALRRDLPARQYIERLRNDLAEEFEAAWKCLSCNNVTRRERSNLLMRSTQIPLDDNMNMSYEIESQAPISSYKPCTPTTPAASVRDCVALETGATFHTFTQELHKTLEEWRSDMNNTLTVFKENIKSTLHDWRDEMEASITKLNDDLKFALNGIREDICTLPAEHECLKHQTTGISHDDSELKAFTQFLSAEQDDLKKNGMT
ncbi:unnamed protein product [Parnassius apollo]|uniref:(apollo) hypothetical protein n=1 Tax=Parnassius apollo TaxID=110799 RepID=A0A8S3Y453_PARAO|nr:unnamed protein product [Parnassius apollo]